MSKVFLIAVIIFALLGCSKRVTVSGIALADRHGVIVSVNDTLRKIINEGKIFVPIHKLNETTKFQKYLSITDKNGRFTINPKRTDSLTFKAPYYIKQTYSVGDLLSTKYPYVKLEKLPCDMVECNDTINDFYAMVVKKISLERVEPGYCENTFIRFDSKYSGKYKVIENIYGDYANDTIEFIIFDHNGRPALDDFDTILIYLSEACNAFYHVKYQFANVYITDNGRWATPYSPYHYQNVTSSSIKPEIIKFVDEISFSLDGLNEDFVKKSYPAPYYKIRDNQAIAIYGNYIEDIFEMAKDPVLKSFGFEFNK